MAKGIRLHWLYQIKMELHFIAKWGIYYARSGWETKNIKNGGDAMGKWEEIEFKTRTLLVEEEIDYLFLSDVTRIFQSKKIKDWIS